MNLKDKLMGALIGISRATNGNEGLITRHTDKLMVEGILATADNATTNDETLQTILDGVVEEKKRIIPNCFYCASDCLRKMDYDMTDLENATEEIRSIKINLLSDIRELAAYAYQAELQGQHEESLYELLYTVLYAIGMDWSSDEFLPVLNELNHFKKGL